MITVEPIPTPKELYKALRKQVATICANYEYCKRKDIADPLIQYQQVISDVIQDFTHNHIPSCYAPSFAKHLRVYMYAYRHHRLGGVSRG